jgi:predicted secreted protein
MAKLAAKGTLLAYESSPSPSTYTTIPGVQDFDLPLVGTKDEIDVTSHDSVGGYEETILGIARTASFTAPIVWDGTNTTHAALLAAAKADTVLKLRVTAKDTKVYSFNAYCKGITLGFPLNGAQVAQVEFKPTGDITVT